MTPEEILANPQTAELTTDDADMIALGQAAAEFEQSKALFQYLARLFDAGQHQAVWAALVEWTRVYTNQGRAIQLAPGFLEFANGPIGHFIASKQTT